MSGLHDLQSMFENHEYASTTKVRLKQRNEQTNVGCRVFVIYLDEDDGSFKSRDFAN